MINKLFTKNVSRKEDNMIQRARRLRQNEILRKMVRETRMDKSSLVYPMFVREGKILLRKFRQWRDNSVIVLTGCLKT